MISGGIKFFLKNQSLFVDGASLTASTGNAAGPRALDKNRFTYWTSVGSDDTTVETIDIVFPQATLIDRILLVDMNWKEFTVKYDLSGSPTDFTTVVGLDGALGGGITETTFADDTGYYEFDPVTVTTINITVTKSQVVDAQKKLNQFIATTELGTLVGYPKISRVVHSRNLRRNKMLSGRMLIQKSEDSIDYRLQFQDYPASLSADIDLMFTLHDSEEEFISWLCGGRRGSDFFKKELRGFRLKDVISSQVDRDVPVSYSKNVYQLPVNMRFSFVEHV